MADPFSIGVGVVGVVGLAIQIVQVVTRCGLDWKDAPTEVKAVREELQVLAQTLSITQTNILQNPDFAAAFDNRPSLLLSQLGPNAPNDTNTKVMLQSCERHLRDLLHDLEKRARGHRVGWERLKGAFLAKHTRESVGNLYRQCQTLNNMVVIDAVALSAKIHTEVMAIQEEQRDSRQEQRDAIVASQRWRQEDRAQTILQWLSATDYGTQQSDFFQRQQDGTGQWLLDSTEFRNWRSNNATTLYCHGMPGAGKTIMTSIVVNQLCTEFEYNPSTGIAYLYCDFRRKGEQKPINLLASLLKQLILNQPKMPPGVERLYENHLAKQTRPLLGEILTELHFVASTYSKSFIIVDALDECSISEGGRQEFISELLNLQAKARSNIFVTSRINPQIARELRTGYTRLEVRASDADVRKYLESQVHRLPAFVQRSTEVQKEIKNGITNAVRGM
ncbi:hypothetical protein GJ744_011008 [Endocarpon pusillum]|uniref:Nephrocystin 3-like N-terminal domain-containing protein n=1 Tax=Endocarpon pusillum TaxID=364733 RepID=A0A8H7AF83_9EURO|nr:hypothetical protein GJ744_011008 [Endocarpon pusillum]